MREGERRALMKAFMFSTVLSVLLTGVVAPNTASAGNPTQTSRRLIFFMPDILPQPPLGCPMITEDLVRGYRGVIL